MPPASRLPRPWLPAAAFALFAAALLTIVPAPIYALAALAIVITEWGHVGAVAALLLALGLARRPDRRSRSTAAAAVAATVLLAMPATRAALVGRDLPASLAARFGARRLTENTGIRPLSAATLFTMPRASAVEIETRVYVAHEGRELAMDLFRDPSTPAPRPTILVVHGGSWQSGTRAEFRAMNEHLGAKGWLVASIDYRLAPQSPFPAAVDDVRSAIAYLKTHAAELSADSSRIALIGRSAGAQLALLAAYTAADPSVRGVVGFYGPSDMRYAFEHPNNPWILDSHATLTAYLGGSPAKVGAIYDAASPIAHVSASTPPTLLIHGGRDQLVQEMQSARLDDALARAGRAHYFLRLGWATHACDYNLNGPCGQLSTYAVDYFLDSVLR